jgi:poly(A) polymerase
VFPSDLISDLFRRDFTINAIAQDLTNYELIDPYNGLSDLRRGVIRVLHPNSFIDDPTRIFRAIRFAERFNFKIEPKTLQWLRTAIKNKLPSLLSGERILNELRLIMKETKSNAMISRLNKEEIFDSLFGRHLSGTFFTQFGKVAKPEEPNLMLIHLLTQFSLPEKFPLTKQEMSAIVNLKRFPEAGMALAKTNLPSDIYKVLRSFSDDALRIAEAIEDRKIARKIKKYRLNYQKVKIELGGNDIKALGIPPGAAYSKMLDNLLFARLDGEVKNRTEEMKLLKVMVKRLRI